MPSLKLFNRKKKKCAQIHPLPQLPLAHPQLALAHPPKSQKDVVEVVEEAIYNPLLGLRDPDLKKVLILFAVVLVLCDSYASVLLKLLLVCYFSFHFDPILSSSNKQQATSNPRIPSPTHKEELQKYVSSSDQEEQLPVLSASDLADLKDRFAGKWNLISRHKNNFEQFLQLQGEGFVRRKAAANASLKKTMTFQEGRFHALVVIGGWFQIKEQLEVGGKTTVDEVDGYPCVSKCYFEHAAFVVHKMSKTKGIEVWFTHTLNEKGGMEVELLAKKSLGGGIVKEAYTRDVFAKIQP